ncbi:amino acid adenylation domain-containing protein [Kibdelosporangium banguiense]|uniref:Amino acid adenylation domain-containing protein n=1 Tax=Kibdelosporangium banguiense TaxID=1365924 RepID=A0ABS4U2U9_9PSEU|nr:non-ribosomal peptide synthetase [Kibdelosporangium banguiense]MBP2330534.1 amino acid adenylation domain-containing protein [Kibdelosporangium banguiense]
MLPARPAPPERTLLDVLDATIHAHPNSPAIDDGKTVLTYAALAQEVELTRAHLRTAGIGVGDRVGVRMPSGTADIYLAILAILASGAAYVPVDVDDPDERAEMVWEQAGVCAILEAGQELRLRAKVPACGTHRRPTPDDDAWIIFTSGTTGRPKGVAVTHRSAAALADAETRMFLPDSPLRPGDRILAGFSVAFDASCEEMWLAWRSGACLVPAPRILVRSGAELCPWLNERGVTVVSTVPTLAALWPADALPGVRLLILGGENCPPELATRFLHADREVWNTYGPTETAVVACGWQFVRGEIVRIGLPLDGWQLAVVNEDGAPVRWGEVGELVIGGVGVARYLDPSNEAGRYVPIPALGWSRAYRSGDLVRAEREGLVFVGRNDEQVKVRGHRIEPAAISAALSTHPAVRQAHVRAVDDHSSGKRLVAYAVLNDVNGVEVPDLRRHLVRSLPSVMLPDAYVLLTSMPVTLSGKIDASALPIPPATPRAAVVSTPPATMEELVQTIWREVLGVGNVGLDESFFDIGGHSLLLGQVQERLADALGRPVSSVVLFANPTVRLLATYLRQDQHPAAQPVAAERIPARTRLQQRRNRLTRPADTAG